MKLPRVSVQSWLLAFLIFVIYYLLFWELHFNGLSSAPPANRLIIFSLTLLTFVLFALIPALFLAFFIMRSDGYFRRLTRLFLWIFVGMVLFGIFFGTFVHTGPLYNEFENTPSSIPLDNKGEGQH